MNYFNSDGRRIPSKEMRVFSEVPRHYYELRQPSIDYSKILNNSIRFGGVDKYVTATQFEAACERLKSEIK